MVSAGRLVIERQTQPDAMVAVLVPMLEEELSEELEDLGLGADADADVDAGLSSDNDREDGSAVLRAVF